MRFFYMALYLVLAPFLGGLLAGLDRKLSARMQGRKGPPLFQPFYDLFKLFNKQAVVVNNVQSMIQYLLYRLVFLSAFMACLIQLKYSLRKTIAIVSAFILVLWSVNFPVYLLKGQDFLNYVWPLTVSLPACIVFFLLSRQSFFKVLFSFFTVCNFGMLTSYMGFLSIAVCDSLFVRVGVEVFGFVVLVLFMIKLFREPYFKVLETLDKGWVLLSSVPTLMSVILYLLLYYPNEINYRPEALFVTFFAFVLLFAFYITLYYNFENISKYYQLMHENELIRLQIEMHQKEYQSILEKVNGMRIYRHDMRHQINTIRVFLNDNNIEEVQKYLNILDSNFSKTVIENYCANYAANCVLSFYIGKAKEQQIQVDCQAALSAALKMEEIELGLILANLIDNAIHACKKIQDPEKRKIKIICREQGNQILTQVSNPYIGKIEFDGEFPRSDRPGHGFGTRSVAAIAKKHGGFFSFSAMDGIFKSSVIINAS